MTIAAPSAPTPAHLCRVELQVGAMRHVDAPGGRRMVGEIETSRWEGDRFRATQVGSATDWLSHLEDDLATVDVRLVLETDDGAIVLVRYTGRSDRRSDAITTAVWFDTGDERYAWLNRVLAVGQGRFDPATARVAYQVWELG